jgi:hypothetical protein
VLLVVVRKEFICRPPVKEWSVENLAPYLALFSYGVIAEIQLGPMPHPEASSYDVMATPFQKGCQSELCKFLIIAEYLGVCSL